jgi:hypothetical protein
MRANMHSWMPRPRGGEDRAAITTVLVIVLAFLVARALGIVQ